MRWHVVRSVDHIRRRIVVCMLSVSRKRSLGLVVVLMHGRLPVTCKCALDNKRMVSVRECRCLVRLDSRYGYRGRRRCRSYAPALLGVKSRYPADMEVDHGFSQDGPGLNFVVLQVGQVFGAWRSRNSGWRRSFKHRNGGRRRCANTCAQWYPSRQAIWHRSMATVNHGRAVGCS